MGGRVKPGIELKIFCSDTILNYQLSQKFKLLGNDEFNHLTIILTAFFFKSSVNTVYMVAFCKVLISYIDTTGSTMTRQKALKEQYLFTCACPRCIKLVLATLCFLGFVLPC